MRSTMQTRIAAGVVAVSGLLVLASFAHAGGCCGGGGGGSRGGFLPRAFYSAPTARGGASCCNMTGMAMGGMNMAATPQAPMAGMNMAAPAPAAPQNGMAGMNMAAPAPPCSGAGPGGRRRAVLLSDAPDRREYRTGDVSLLSDGSRASMNSVPRALRSVFGEPIITSNARGIDARSLAKGGGSCWSTRATHSTADVGGGATSQGHKSPSSRQAVYSNRLASVLPHAFRGQEELTLIISEEQ